MTMWVPVPRDELTVALGFCSPSRQMVFSPRETRASATFTSVRREPCPGPGRTQTSSLRVARGPLPPTARTQTCPRGGLVPTAWLRECRGPPTHSAGHYQDGVAGRVNEGADILGVAGSDPVPRVGDRDHRGIHGIASAGPSQKNPRTLAQRTVHRPDVDRTK